MSRRAWLAFAVVALLVTVVAAMILPPPAADTSNALSPPSGSHWFGTDALGRDVMYRSALAIGYSLGRSLFVLAVAGVAGAVLASVSALYYARWGDRLVVLVAETIRAYPTLLLVLLFASAGVPVAFLLIMYFWIPVWRLLRTELVSQQRQPYALVARLSGLSRLKVLLSEVLPNVGPRVAPYAAGLLSEIISAQCAIEFLGFGPPLEQQSLGGLLLESGQMGLAAPWIWMPSLLAVICLVAGLAWAVRRYRREIRWVPIG